jgi:hypothetical protein
MNGKPIHQNLSTAFVDLPSLVRHLRDLQFSGIVFVELSSYHAEILFPGDGRIYGREYDKLVGRIAQGNAALIRILRRSREKIGRISIAGLTAAEIAKYARKPFIDDRITDAASGYIISCLS